MASTTDAHEAQTRRRHVEALQRAAAAAAKADAAARPKDGGAVQLLTTLLTEFHDARWPYLLEAAHHAAERYGHAVFVQAEAGRGGGRDVLVVVTQQLTTVTGPTGTRARRQARQQAAMRLDRHAKAWRAEHVRDRIWGVLFLNARPPTDGLFQAHRYSPPSSPTAAEQLNEDVREVRLPALPAAWLPAGGSTPDQVQAVADALQTKLYLLPTEQSLRQLNGAATVVAFFGCTPCHLLWARRVPVDKPRSSCKKCRQLYERIPLADEPVGLGFFKCPRPGCGRRWTSNPSARNVPQPCFAQGCTETAVLPYRLIPYQLLGERKRGERRSDHTHSCAHCRAFGVGPDGRCPLAGRRGVVASRPSDPTASVASSILSGPSVRQYRPSNMAMYRQRYQSRLDAAHMQDALSDSDDDAASAV